jgi:hypothetical protein
MTAPPAAPRPAPWWLARLLFAVAGACALIAALAYTGTITSNAPAWLAGAFAAFAFGWAVP